VVLAVKDDGQGMNEETRRHIFEPFFTTKDVGKGSGLGLSIVYGIVKQHGGEIVVQSVEGKGTEIAIYLPAYQEDATETADESPAQQVVSGGTGTILIVEDEENVRALVRAMLQKQGYNVLVSQNAEEAARLSEEHAGKLDLLVTDVVMPGMSGPELALQLTALRPDLKVLYMSGHADSAVARHHIGPDAPFIQKPFRSDALSRKVRDVLG
jgi:two-component system cell cycle sensor histidine kinase/response regulator CckA